MGPPYVYRPLERPDEIGVLLLLPDDDEDEIKIRLEYAAFQSREVARAHRLSLEELQ